MAICHTDKKRDGPRQREGCHEVWNLNFFGFIEDAIY